MHILGAQSERPTGIEGNRSTPHWTPSSFPSWWEVRESCTRQRSQSWLISSRPARSVTQHGPSCSRPSLRATTCSCALPWHSAGQGVGVGVTSTRRQRQRSMIERLNPPYQAELFLSTFPQLGVHQFHHRVQRIRRWPKFADVLRCLGKKN
jgi:hypothetical protein